MKRFKGEVAWFCKSRGEGMIYSPDHQQVFYVHYSAINSNQDFKVLNKGAEVEFVLYTNLYMSQVEYVKEVA